MEDDLGRETGTLNETDRPKAVLLAGEQGLEPQLTDPESVVLPLDDSPLLFRPPFRSHKLVYQMTGGDSNSYCGAIVGQNGACCPSIRHTRLR